MNNPLPIQDFNFKEAFKKINYEKYGPLFALTILFVISSLASPYFLKPRNLMNILRQVSYTGIIGLGMTFVIISGGIDLSVGSMTALVGGIVWWAQKAIADWEAKDPDVEFFLVTADSASTQVGNVEDLMVKGIDALVILAHDSAPLTPIVEEAKKEGIYIVSVDRGLTKPVEDIYIAGDNSGLGRVSGEWMVETLNGKGKIVVLEGIPCVINSERVDAFNSVMDDYTGIEILDSQPAHWSTQKGLEIMENYLQKYDDIDAVWAQDDDVLKGVLQAYKESGRDDIDIFLGGAGSKDIIKMIMDGNPLVKADVTYHPAMIATGLICHGY